MSFKKILIFSIILVLSINAVSADDSLSDLQVMVDNSDGVLDLDSDISVKEGDSGSAVQINKDITINGNNHTIDGSGFDLSLHYAPGLMEISDCSVVLENLNFVNVSLADYGGALKISNSNVTIKNCNFINNIAFAAGAIDVWHSNCSIDSSAFLSNYANIGPAIYLDCLKDNKVTISNSRFYDNEGFNEFGIIRPPEHASDEPVDGEVHLDIGGNLLDHQIELSSED